MLFVSLNQWHEFEEGLCVQETCLKTVTNGAEITHLTDNCSTNMT